LRVTDPAMSTSDECLGRKLPPARSPATKACAEEPLIRDVRLPNQSEKNRLRQSRR
jgi:hypothetical protein